MVERGQTLLEVKLHVFCKHDPVIFAWWAIRQSAVMDVDQPVKVALKDISGAAHMLTMEHELAVMHDSFTCFGIDFGTITQQQ